MEVFRRIAEALFSRPNGRRETPPPAPAAPPPLRFDSPEFAQRLRLIAKHNGGRMTVGGLKVIGLAHVRDHFGDEWPRMRRKVHNIVRQAIEKRIGNDDLYATFRDVSYVILFGTLSEEAARLKCAMIADEIAGRVFGVEARADLIEIATSTIDAGGKISLSAARLGDFVANLGAEAHATEVAPPGRAPDMPPLTKEMTEDAQPPSPSQAPPGTVENGDNRWVAIERTREEYQDLAELRERLAAELKASLPPREQKLFDFGSLQFLYRPLWLVKKNVTSALVCIPARVTSEGTLRIGGAALLSSPGAVVNAEYDAATLKGAIDELTVLDRLGRSAVLITPVHYITLDRPDLRRQHLERLLAVPEHLRAKIVTEIIAIPSGAPPTRLIEAIGVTRLHTPTVLVRTRVECRDFSHLAGTGVYAVGVDLTNFAVDEARLLPCLEKFVAAAEAVGLRTYAQGLRSKSLVTAAVCAGVRYINGDPVTSVVEQATDNRPFAVSDIYGDLASPCNGP